MKARLGRCQFISVKKSRLAAQMHLGAFPMPPDTSSPIPARADRKVEILPVDLRQ
jgi:hypothetical protein